MITRLHIGDALAVLQTMPDQSVQCIVTSPPYYGLRDYGIPGQVGLEPTPEAFVAAMVAIFREARRVLRDDGTLWLNLGDSYANDGKWGGHTGGKHVKALHASPIGRNKRCTGLKPKDLIGIPWRVALALQADGWYLRADIIWSKPNCMPSSVRDRPTTAHEYIFLLSKRAKYFYDAEAIAEPLAESTMKEIRKAYTGTATKDFLAGGAQDASATKRRTVEGLMKKVRGKPVGGWAEGEGSHSAIDHNQPDPADRLRRKNGKNMMLGQGANRDRPGGRANKPGRDMSEVGVPVCGGKNAATDPQASERRMVENVAKARAAGAPHDNPFGLTRNRRSVWTITPKAFREAHFATFPPELPELCIKAGSREGDTVLDPFAGAGTTLMVASRLGRVGWGIELNPEYARIAAERIEGDGGFLADVEIAR